MNWDAAKVIRTESNKFHRWIKVAVEIRKRAPKTVNWDEGAYQLSHTWATVLQGHPRLVDKPPDGRGRPVRPQHTPGDTAIPPPQTGWKNPYNSSQMTSH